LLLQLLNLLVEPLELALDDRLSLERLAGEIIAPSCERLARLRLELDHRLLELRRLKLEPLLRRHDVGDASLDVLEQLQLALVRVIEGLARILGAIEQLREFRFDNRRSA